MNKTQALAIQKPLEIAGVIFFVSMYQVILGDLFAIVKSDPLNG